MNAWTRRALSTAAAVPLLVGVAGCGDSDEEAEEREAAGRASAACGALPSADPAASLPPGFPTLDGQVLYEPSKQGSTTIVFGRVAGEDFVGIRDQLTTKLVAAGYTIPGKDQESVEAEAEFDGPHVGTIKVQPLCEGYVYVRYKVEQ